jgi:hypothetical protein
MQKLCARVAELLRKNPILWLPYIAADLLASCLWRLRGLAEKSIFHWFTTGHSVLGGDVALPSNDSLARASVAYAPIGIATIIAVGCLFVIAFVATAGMVDSFEREQRPDTRDILSKLAAQWRRIVLFALRFLITVGAIFGATTALSYYLLFLAQRQHLLTSFWLIAGLLLIGVGCTGWLIMPAAIRLLRGATVLVSTQARCRGTILAVAAAGAGAALGFLVPKLEASMLPNAHWELTVLSAFNSVIANSPDALLFTALAFLPAECSREDDGEEGSKGLKLLRLLMPLHFGKDEEPPKEGA